MAPDDIHQLTIQYYLYVKVSKGKDNSKIGIYGAKTLVYIQCQVDNSNSMCNCNRMIDIESLKYFSRIPSEDAGR